jgi:hypothetical protein
MMREDKAPSALADILGDMLHLLTAGFGTKLPIWNICTSVAIRGKVDIIFSF